MASDTQPIRDEYDDGVVDGDMPTEPTTLQTDIRTHISLLYDGSITRAMQNVLITPVRAEVDNGAFANYPSPAEAWHYDPLFRQWVLEITDYLYKYHKETDGRFNIISFINLITCYDNGHNCFVRWYYRMWKRGGIPTSWTIQRIRRARLYAQKAPQD